MSVLRFCPKPCGVPSRHPQADCRNGRNGLSLDNRFNSDQTPAHRSKAEHDSERRNFGRMPLRWVKPSQRQGYGDAGRTGSRQGGPGLMSRNEAQTRFKLIDPALEARGWKRTDIRIEVTAAQTDIVDGNPRTATGHATRTGGASDQRAPRD